MHYWIDGYNLLFRLPVAKGPLEKKRQSLILELNTQATTLNLQITVVFDSSTKERILDTRSHYDALEIIYTSSKKTADDSILDSVEFSSYPEDICVVTCDKDLARKAKALRANTLSLDAFFKLITKRQNKKQRELEDAFECLESPREISRLLSIFEKKFTENTKLSNKSNKQHLQ